MTAKKERTREGILDVSYKLFAKNGFNKVTMKDVCEAANLSRGGLYSHFSGTREIFEAILDRLNQREEMDFYQEIEAKEPAVQILEKALLLLEEEMKNPEDSLSVAMYEYAGTVDKELMNELNRMGEEKWTALILYGIQTGEFKEVDVKEIVNVILYAYQGVRLWSRIITMHTETFSSITNHIRKQLIKE